MRDCGIPESAYREHPGDFTVKTGIEMMERAIERGEVPEALACANDLMALGAIEIADPPLTSIRPPVHEMDVKTVDLLRAPNESAREIIFLSKLMLWDSTRQL
jgi:DNA-binding LacI/PurR family transcriptional regulator